MTTFLWTSFRGANLPAPAANVNPVTAIVNSLISDQAAATTVALAAGYVSCEFKSGHMHDNLFSPRPPLLLLLLLDYLNSETHQL